MKCSVLNTLKSTVVFPSLVARGYRRKRFYSTPMRILAHLSSGAASETASLSVLTQEGIASVTHSGRTTATKWLSRMEAQGLIAGERAHVPGHRVRKTVYRLTHEGWAEANKLRTRLRSDIVEVLAPGLDPTPMRTAEIPEIFPGYVNLTAAVSLVKGGRLDFTKLHGIGSGAVAPILWGDTVRRLGRLFGRTDEIRTLDAWAGSASSLFVVTGIAGIGKSTLVASWLVRQRPRPYLYWFEIHDGTTRAVFLRDLAAFLARIGRRGLKNLLSERHAPDLQVTARVLARDLQDVSILLVLDNYHRATSELADFIVGPILELCSGNPMKILLISRALPTGLIRRKAAKDNRVEILRLEGLETDASLSLLRTKGFAGDEVSLQRVASSARGHPILLSFAAQTGSAVSGEMTIYLEREIWRTLTKDERVVLEAASLFRGLVPLDSLHCFADEWQGAVHGLQGKNLLAPTLSGGVIVHDAIQEYVRERLPDSRRRSFHSLAATYFLDGSEMRDHLEGLYHLAEAGDMKAFGDYLAARDKGLLDSVPASELLTVLRKIDGSSLSPVAACVLPELIGDSLRALGDLKPAVLEYGHALRRCDEHARQERIPTLLRKIASVERCKNDHAKALGHLVEAQGRLKAYANALESGEVLREMALLQKAKGQLSDAAAHMNQAVDLATEASDPSALARSLTALGSIENDRGNLEQGLQYKLEGLRIAERGGNLTETARASIAAGVSCHTLGRFEESLTYYDRALQVARLVGNLRLIAYATMNRCASLLDMGRAGETGAELAEARQLVQILEERDTLAFIDIYDGQRESELGRSSRAVRLWDQGLRTLRQFGERSDLARSLTAVGRACLEHGDTDEARRHLAEALSIGKVLGNATLISEIESLLRPLDAPQEPSAPTREDA